MAENNPIWSDGNVYFSNATTVSPAPDWSDGNISILLEYEAPAGGLSIPVAMQGAWKEATPKIMINSAWHDVEAAKILIAGAWKEVT